MKDLPGGSIGDQVVSRLVWVDVARGVAILLVVLYHSVLFAEGMGLRVGPWVNGNEILRSFRMPLFFLVSGVLSAGTLGWAGARVWRERVVVWLWVYLVWSLINFGVFSVVPWLRSNDPADSASDLLGIFVWPNNGLWYLYALPIFLAVAWFTRRWSGVVVVGLAAGCAVLFGAEVLRTGNFAFDNIGTYGVFFMAGIRFRSVFLRHVKLWRFSRRCVALIFYGIVSSTAYLVARSSGLSLGDLSEIFSVRFLWGVSAALAGVALSTMLVGHRLGSLLASLGRRTLPIYVAHEIILGCIVALSIPLADKVPSSVVLGVPLLLMGVAVLIALFLWLTLRSFAPWLYSLPGWLVSKKIYGKTAQKSVSTMADPHV